MSTCVMPLKQHTWILFSH